MPTVFYQDKYEQPLPITGMLLEILGIKLKQFEEAPTGDDVHQVLRQCLEESGLAKDPTDEQVVYVAEELQQRHEKTQEKGEEASGAKGKGKYFAGYFADWASDMPYDKLCFYVAGYDYAKAKDYYETHDQQTIVALADEKLRLEFELARVSFEASLFGFGGGYKDTPKEGDAVFDLSIDGDESGERALKNLGF